LEDELLRGELMKKGFTLAEVLITLCIIAVISVLTLPSLIKDYKYKVYSTSIEKTYSQLTDAVKSIMNDEMTNSFYATTAGVIDSADCTKGACYFLKNYLKSSRFNCQNETPSCVASEYHSSNPNLTDGVGIFGSCAQTNNGATICMTMNSSNGITSVFVDTNGQAEPNIAGLDAFVLNITANGTLVDWSDNSQKCNTKSSSYGHIADYAIGCLTKVMDNGWKVTD
jgi:prepilin-type N-terminal cleavage/methylation domain-containing protein